MVYYLRILFLEQSSARFSENIRFWDLEFYRTIYRISYFYNFWIDLYENFSN